MIMLIFFTIISAICLILSFDKFHIFLIQSPKNLAVEIGIAPNSITSKSVTNPKLSNKTNHIYNIIKISIPNEISKLKSFTLQLFSSLKRVFGFPILFLTKMFRNAKTNLTGTSDISTKDRSRHEFNDHVALPSTLSSSKLHRLSNILSSPLLHDDLIQKMAETTHYNIDTFLVYRYLAAADWSDDYNGKRVDVAVRDSIIWRHSFGIHNISYNEILPLLTTGLSYVSPVPDKLGRTIIFVVIRKYVDFTPETFLKFIMYTVERAEGQCVMTGSGQFLTIIDLAQLSWRNCPPLSSIKTAMEYLKHHYPHRLSRTYIIHAAGTFKFLWNILKPLIPKKVLGKTHVLGRKETKDVLDEHLGLDCLDHSIGGKVLIDLSSEKQARDYFLSGYWH